MSFLQRFSRSNFALKYSSLLAKCRVKSNFQQQHSLKSFSEYFENGDFFGFHFIFISFWWISGEFSGISLYKFIRFCFFSPKFFRNRKISEILVERFFAFFISVFIEISFALNAFRRKCRLILQNMFSQFHLKFEKNCATYSMRMIYGKNLVHSSFLQFIFCISNFFLNLSFLLILFDFRIAVYLKNKE